MICRRRSTWKEGLVVFVVRLNPEPLEYRVLQQERPTSSKAGPRGGSHSSYTTWRTNKMGADGYLTYMAHSRPFLFLADAYLPSGPLSGRHALGFV